MRVLQVTNDLILEVWAAGGEGDRPLLKLRSLSMEKDGEGGSVVIWSEEIDSLVAALWEGQDILARERGTEWEEREHLTGQ